MAALKGTYLHITAVMRVPSAVAILREFIRIAALWRSERKYGFEFSKKAKRTVQTMYSGFG